MATRYGQGVSSFVIDTDATMAANSDAMVPSQKAVRTALATASPAAATHAATSKATPVDADELPLVDSTASWGLKRLTWANLKAALGTVFATLDGNQTITGTKTFRPSSYQPAFGANIAPAMSAWSGSGAASLSGETWTLGPGAWTLSCSASVVSGTMYQIDTNTTPYASAGMTVSLGSVTMDSSNDPGRIGIVAAATGMLTLSVSGTNTGTNSGTWTVRPVTLSSPSAVTGVGEHRSYLDNTANGFAALYNNTTGNYNTANGYAALRSNTTGSYNTANGLEALRYNTTGSDNTANGYAALRSNTTGSYNTANGRLALRNNTTGSSNTANGRDALRYNTTGSDNTANGYAALYSNTTGSSNTAVGNSAGPATGAIEKSTSLGAVARANHDRSVALGSDTTTTAEDQVMVGPRDIEVSSATKGVVLRSPNGSRWRLTVDNSGIVTAIAV